MSQQYTKGVPTDSDPLLAADSDLYIPTQKAVRGYAEPKQTAATQAEMEAGLESAIRSMSPLRIKQAITALSGASGNGFSNLKVVLATEAWTPPQTGTYRVHVIGAGGSGGAYRCGTGATGGATGGGAGGYARKILTLSSAVEYTLTIGAGGTAVSATADNTGTNGNAGGNSSISGSDISTITGGGGGAGSASSSSSTVSGASGGTASGGDGNFTGGGSGSITGVGRKATGGGAVAIFGTGYASGNADSSSASFYALTGGGGVGGKSGNATATTANTSSMGGNTGSASGDQTNAGATATNAATVAALGMPAAWSIPPFSFSTSHTLQVAQQPPGVGGSRPTIASSRGGVFAGGSGGIAASGNNDQAGSSVIGGGGGGCCTSVANATSGDGGPGIILIEW